VVLLIVTTLLNVVT